MNKVKRIFLGLCLLFIYNGSYVAQSRSALEDQAYDNLSNLDFAKAYEAFDQLHSRYPKELDYEFKLGICCLSYPEKKERAIEIFQDIKNKYKTSESELYLGKAYHANYRFDEALAVLRPLLATLAQSKKKEDQVFMDRVQVIINNCENGKILVQNKLNSDVKNIGAPINSKEVEAVPIITADESMMIFTYIGKKSLGGKLNTSMQPDPNGEYTSDIFMSTKKSDSTWNIPQPITALNTKGNDAAIAMSPDGLMLFTFLSTNESEGDICVSHLNGTEFSTPELLNKNVNTPDHWEGSCSISADGKFLYFASERPEGGFGGRDLWVSELINDDWGPAVNLGPNVNTQYDEDAPFIHPDGVTLFFSSKGHASMGDYDIMFTTKQGTEWSEPKSMGIPLNTTEDDRYYVINSRGDKGYFSSNRSTAESKGAQDIYMVSPGSMGEKLIVGLFKGKIYGDNKPIEARIDIVKLSRKENLGPFYSNKATGKYLLTLKPGSIYKVKVYAEGYDAVEEEIDLETMDGYWEKKKDFYLYSQPFASANPSEIKVDTTVLSPVKTKTTAIVSVPKEEVPTATIAAVRPKEEVKKPEEVTTMTKEVATVIKEKKKPVKETEPAKEEPFINAPCNSKLPELAGIKGKSLNNEAVYKQLMSIAGEYCADGLQFKVQVGAYRKPENFKYTNLEPLGSVVSANYPDGITRFTQKQFTTLKQAEAHRQKAIAKGQKDAWIVAFMNGQRYTLEDFIMVDFQGKTIQ